METLFRQLRLCGMATVLVAILLSSCHNPDDPSIDFSVTPVQVVHDMNMLQSGKGETVMRLSAPLMERFSYMKDSLEVSYELYSGGFLVKEYIENGTLETTIEADQAKHVTTTGAESWSAFGNVVITNYIKGERMETDTIYWNKEEQQIYTDCYVRLTSDSNLLQGYGMTSDERARNAIILRPFDWYAIDRDSTYQYIDTINQMGPARK